MPHGDAVNIATNTLSQHYFTLSRLIMATALAVRSSGDRLSDLFKSPEDDEADDALQELNSFLSRMSDEELQSLRSRRSSVVSELWLGNCCKDCRTADRPVVHAVEQVHVGCLREMIQAQPNLQLAEIRLENGATLAHAASRRGSLETLRLLSEGDQSLFSFPDQRGATPLHACAYYGHTDCLEDVLSKVNEVNTPDHEGATPIHFAAVSGHLECLKKLLTTEKEKADANATTASGETAVYFAAQEGHFECVTWLVENGNADPTIASRDGMTPLHAAAQTGQFKIVYWLVRTAHCPVNCQTQDGATPVHFAAAKGHISILEWMLHHSLASGLEEDEYGATPVHDAAEQGQLECLHVFYNHSVTLTCRDTDELTPRDLAEEKGHHECVAFLDNPELELQQWRKKHLVQEASRSAMLGWTQSRRQEGVPVVKKKKTLKELFTKRKVFK